MSGGMLYKLNVDLSPIAGHEMPQPNGDALSAWVIYELVESGA